MTATTALTAQNTQGVVGIHLTPSSFVEKQINACIDDIGVDVVKTGVLHQIIPQVQAKDNNGMDQVCWPPQIL